MMEEDRKDGLISLSAGKMRQRRGLVFVMLAALVSISCVCSTANLPDFIADLIGGEEAQQAAPPESQILLEDDFSDPNSGWEKAEFDAGSVGYTDGNYFVISSEPSAAMWGVAGRSFEDVLIEVEATQVQAPANNNNDYGVMCRLTYTGDGYSFNISGDGYYSIQKMESNSFSDLVEWTESSAIHKGGETNRIQVICHGSTLVLVVNGEKLAEVIDETYSEGDIALAATTYEEAPTEIHFDNLLVREP